MKTTLHSVSSTSRRLSWIAGLLFLTLSAASITACSDDSDVNKSDTDITADVSNNNEDDTGDSDTGFTDTDPEDVGDDPQDADPDTSEPDDTGGDTDDVETDVSDDDADVIEPPDDTDASDPPDVPAPVLIAIEAIEPNRGSVDGGTSFVIKGSALSEDTEVFFGARRVPVELVDGKLHGETPGASGVGPVNVKLLDPVSGSDTLVGGFTYTAPLEIFSVTPSVLPTAGDVEVTIQGFGFTNDTRISFGGNTAARHTLIDNTLMRVLTPAHPAGVVDVRASNPEGTFVLPQAVTYFEALNIASVSPAAGPSTGNQTITLTGAGFETGMTVDFGGEPATNVQVASDGTSATVTTPAHAQGLVYVRAETADGNAALLPDAFYFYDNATTLNLAALTPQRGPQSGGIDIKIIGSGLDAADLVVLFGNAPADVLEQHTDHAIVKIPAGANIGPVDVTVQSAGQPDSVLVDAFTYVTDLWIDAVTPDTGSVDGGDVVEILGEGFTGASRVLFGGLAAEFTIEDDGTITAITPAHSAATVDLVIERDGIQSTYFDAFTFVEDMAIYGFFPMRGSIAGNTYIEIRGRGFSGTPEVTFGTEPGVDVRVLDSQTITVRTPPHRSGAVDLKVSLNNDQAVADSRYTYFNSGARFGGAWGGPIEGAVNVTVFNTNDAPVVGAHVMLSTNAATPYIGITNEDGMVTLSGPDVYGEQTVTAVAAKYASTTVQRINAENITIFLEGGDQEQGGGGTPVAGPADATFTGKLTGLNKLEEPKQGERLVAYIFTTQRSAWQDNPDPGPGAIVTADGTYTIKSRLGDLALIAVGGIYTEATQSFRPIRMGVVRYLFAADSERYNVNIPLDINLDRTLSMKYNNIPANPGGSSINHIQPFLDLGFEGLFPMLSSASGTGDILTAPQMAPLSGKLADGRYFVIGGTYRNSGAQLFDPSSEAFVRDITDIDSVQPMPPLPGIVNVTSPTSGGQLIDRTVHFTINSTVKPEYFRAMLVDPLWGDTVWEAFIPGDATSIRFPDFPSFSHLPAAERPVPYPGGTYQLIFFGLRGPNMTYEGFSYDDLAYSAIESVSVGYTNIRF